MTAETAAATPRVRRVNLPTFTLEGVIVSLTDYPPSYPQAMDIDLTDQQLYVRAYGPNTPIWQVDLATFTEVATQQLSTDPGGLDVRMSQKVNNTLGYVYTTYPTVSAPYDVLARTRITDFVTDARITLSGPVQNWLLDQLGILK